MTNTKRVPVEPTEEMINVANAIYRRVYDDQDDFASARTVYKAMIAAAPKDTLVDELEALPRHTSIGATAAEDLKYVRDEDLQPIIERLRKQESE